MLNGFYMFSILRGWLVSIWMFWSNSKEGEGLLQRGYTVQEIQIGFQLHVTGQSTIR